MTDNWRILVLGSCGVGKKSLINRYISGSGQLIKSPVVPEETFYKTLKIGDDKEIRVAIKHSPAGTKNPFELPRSFFMGVHGCMFVFSTTDIDSFNDLPDWYSKAMENIDYAPMVFVENKIDSIVHSVLDKEQVELTAKQHHFRLYRTSAKAAYNVDDTFGYLIQKVVKKFPKPDKVPSLSSGTSLSVARVSSSNSSESEKTEEDMEEKTNQEEEESEEKMKPNKLRTGGVKPVLNKYKLTGKREQCIVM